MERKQNDDCGRKAAKTVGQCRVSRRVSPSVRHSPRIMAFRAATVVAALLLARRTGIGAWDVGAMYGAPSPLRARLTDVAVWRNRAYACWPRLDGEQPVTLLELPWPETDQYRRPRWKPRGPFRAEQQVRGVCVRLVLVEEGGNFFKKIKTFSLCTPS